MTRTAEQARSALHQGGYADPDERGRRPGREDVPGADPAEPRRLQHRGDAADGHRAEHGPGQIRLGFSRGADHDRGEGNESGDSEHDELHAASEDHAARWTLVGLVANAPLPLPVPVAHERSRRDGPCPLGDDRIGPGDPVEQSRIRGFRVTIPPSPDPGSTPIVAVSNAGPATRTIRTRRGCCPGSAAAPGSARPGLPTCRRRRCSPPRTAGRPRHT